MSNLITSSYNHHPQQQQNHSFNNSNSTSSINNTNIAMTDDLPKQFVSSLRILFDILDENHSGFVRLSDIESRWKEDGVKGLPAGVVDALKRVTPANGYLNFDRFVAGLKLVLWRSKQHHNMVSSGGSVSAFPHPRSSTTSEQESQGKENKHIYRIDDDDDEDIKPILIMGQPIHPHQFNNLSDIPDRNSDGQFTINNSKQTHDVFNTSGTIPTGTTSLPYGHTGRPNYPQPNYGYHQNVNYSNTSSTSLLTGNGHLRSNNNIHNSSCSSNNTSHDVSRLNESIHSSSGGGAAVPGDKMPPHIQHQQRLPYVTRCPERPPLQPRQSVPHPHGGGHHYNMHLPDNMHDSSTAETLQRPFSPPQVPPRDQNKANILNELKNWQSRQRMKNTDTRRGPEWGRNPSTDTTKDVDRNTYVNIESFQQRRNQDEYGAKKSSELRNSNRRWDGRRHTLTSGVDHSMIKRMRQLEEEKEMLVQGIEVVESARAWYQKQLTSISEKQKLAAWSSYNDSSLEANQERMNFQKTRISEVNQQLKTLIESSERGFPLHMNLAISNTGHPVALEDNSMKMLKEQNRQLTDEISTKCEKITRLEQEKTALIRELFESRSQNKPSLDDTTFM